MHLCGCNDFNLESQNVISGVIEVSCKVALKDFHSVKLYNSNDYKTCRLNVHV